MESRERLRVDVSAEVRSGGEGSRENPCGARDVAPAAAQAALTLAALLQSLLELTDVLEVKRELARATLRCAKVVL